MRLRGEQRDSLTATEEAELDYEFFTNSLFMPLTVGGYAWYIHAWWMGLLAMVAFWMITVPLVWAVGLRKITSPTLSLFSEDRQQLKVVRAVRRTKWTVYIFTMLAIGISGTMICDSVDGCRSIWG